MKQKLLSIFLVCVLVASAAFAQDKRITGKVTAREDGLPLPGVSVKVSGTTIGTQTDGNGNYSLNVPSSAKTLEFSFIGFSQQFTTIGTKTTINVALDLDSKQLSEVVVTGYGTQAKREVGGSIAKVTGAQFENQPIASLDRALQGRAAGVQVSASNGIPGGGINVRIRGSNSFVGGTDPLYIVDGIQLNAATFGGYTQTNTLAGINTNDIESIEVLKDAASSAIYGSQAANGVVIITTKKGKAGKTQFTANVYSGTVEPIKIFDVLNTQEYFNLRVEARNNAEPRLPLSLHRSRTLSEIAQPTTLTDAEIAALPTYNWQDAAFQTGIAHNYEVSARGGSDKTTFFTSGAYNKQQAPVSKSDFQRVTFKANLDHQASSKFSINTSVNLANIIQLLPNQIDGSGFANPAFASSLISPAARIYNDDGTYNQVLPGLLNQNVIQINDYNTGNQKTNQIIGSVTGNYKILPSLTFKSFYSVEYASLAGYTYNDPRTPNGAAIGGSASIFNNQRSNIQTTQTLNFIKTFNKDHKVNVLGGFEYRYDNNTLTQASGRSFPSFLFRNLSAAGTPFSVDQTFTGFKQLSYLGKTQYNFKDKYIVTGTFRYAGSSRFGTNNQFGFFPGVALAWNAHEESFLKNVNWLDNLKLRVSYGQTGSDTGIGNFAARSLYSSAAVYGGVSGIQPTGLGNPALRWERETGLDLGVDYSLLKGRISGSVGIFSTVNSDLLLNQPLLSTSGFTSIASNVGEIKSNGVEVEFTTQNFDTKGGFKWSTSFNFTYVINEITALYGGLNILPADPSIRVGSPRSAIFTFPYAGINPATGRPLFTDVNNNLTYLPTAPDRRFVGNNLPPYFGGITNTFSFKGFDINALFTYQYGQRLGDGQEQFLRENGGREFNTIRETYDRRWTTPGQLTDIPRAFAGTRTEAQGIGPVAGSNLFIKTDFIRLSTAQIGYTVPKSVLTKAKISNFRIYAQGTNLLTISDYRGYDPEFGTTATGIIPQTKNLTFGVQLGF